MREFLARMWHLMHKGKPVQTLYYVEEQLRGTNFAVVRVSWKQEGKVIAVIERKIQPGTEMANEFSEFVEEALSVGNDVAVICCEPASSFGFIE